MLYERYRPKTWGEFIGNEKAVGIMREVLAEKQAKQDHIAFWIDGASGIGKTTIARLCAAELGANGMMDLRELDGDACDKMAVREIGDWLGHCAWGGGYRAVIVNEAHAMTKGAIKAWLTLLERMPRRAAV